MGPKFVKETQMYLAQRRIELEGLKRMVEVAGDTEGARRCDDVMTKLDSLVLHLTASARADSSRGAEKVERR